MEISLEQLKAENAAEEARLLAATASADDDEQETEAAEVEDEPTESDADQPEGETETDVESWMKEDGQTSEDSGDSVPLATLVKTRNKLKGKLHEKDNEIEQLRAELQQLKAGVPAPVVTPKAPPRLEDFDYDDAKYAQAQAQYVADLVSQNLSAHTQKSANETAQKEAQRKIEESLDGHYERAAKLIESAKITAEQYQAADTRFRQAIDQVRPGQGDKIADFLLANLGEGSEKVGFHLGVNQEARAQLQSKLLSDPSGIAAAVWLGAKLKELSPPKQLRSNAPKPAAKLQADESTADSLRSLKSDIAKARKSGDYQKVIDLKFDAKRKGVDVSKL